MIDEVSARSSGRGHRLMLLITLGLLAGCSAQQLYNAGQAFGRSRADCEALISAPERERCEASFERDHAEYERQRREASQ